MTWPLQDAKNKLSEVVDSSRTKGPQIITKRGKNAAVVISYDEYKRYIAPKRSLKSTLMSTGFDALDLARDKTTTGRATDLVL